MEAGPGDAGGKGGRVLRVQESGRAGTLTQALVSSLYLGCQAESGRVCAVSRNSAKMSEKGFPSHRGFRPYVYGFPEKQAAGCQAGLRLQQDRTDHIGMVRGPLAKTKMLPHPTSLYPITGQMRWLSLR